MPGASLWLVAPGTSPTPRDAPSPSSPMPARLQGLIAAALPAAYPGFCHPAPFAPHLTLTSGIDPAHYGDAAAGGPQAWLDALPLADAALPPTHVRFGPLRTADAFVRRATITIAWAGVAPLARAVRAAAVDGGVERVEAWLQAWEPHVSLVYGSKPIDEATLSRMAKTVQEAGVRLGDLGGEGEDVDATYPVPENGGWEGGEIWLVPTYEEIGKWRPIARRVL